MDSQTAMSSRVIFAGIFGVIIIGGAFYYTTTQPKSVVLQPREAAATTEETFSTSPNTLSVSTTSSPTIINQTDILTRNVIGPYIETLENETYTTEDAQRIIENATQEMFTLNYTPLSAHRIVTTTNVSREESLRYKQDLYEAMQPLFALDEYELTLYAEAVDENSKEKFDTLKEVGDIYKAVADAVLPIVTPNDVSAVQLSIVNGLYKFSVVLDALSKGYDDPAASLGGTGNFSIVEEELQQAFANLKTYFILKDIDTQSL